MSVHDVVRAFRVIGQYDKRVSQIVPGVPHAEGDAPAAHAGQLEKVVSVRRYSRIVRSAVQSYARGNPFVRRNRSHVDGKESPKHTAQRVRDVQLGEVQVSPYPGRQSGGLSCESVFEVVQRVGRIGYHRRVFHTGFGVRRDVPGRQQRSQKRQPHVLVQFRVLKQRQEYHQDDPQFRGVHGFLRRLGQTRVCRVYESRALVALHPGATPHRQGHQTLEWIPVRGRVVLDQKTGRRVHRIPGGVEQRIGRRRYLSNVQQEHVQSSLFQVRQYKGSHQEILVSFYGLERVLGQTRSIAVFVDQGVDDVRVLFL
ncbi:hypothetical protein [Cyprinid herpesvirus 2]|nr:hypothetical protein [Cyprinid herpesvirus 2]